MTVKVVKVTEANALDQAGKLSKVVVVTYMVDSHGPFSLTTNQADLNNGNARQQMEAFAASLALLPGIAG